MDERSPSHSSAAAPAEEQKSVLVILVGPPGSGKSTFCESVMSAACRTWARICQDTISNGKAGTKAQCLKAATDALKQGHSIFIDRCNLAQDQRADFIKLGGACTEIHAIVLDLPAKTCIDRSVKRTGHEGNLQGGRAAVVVNNMLKKRELPKLSEGFSRITFCYNDSDVKDTINLYSKLGPHDSLSSGVFGQKGKESVQPGIMKFFKKSIPGAEEKESEGKNGKENLKDNLNESHTLAFPSISTSDFQFDLDKASDIIVERVADFLEKGYNARLVLVDLKGKSKILSLVREKAKKKGIDSSKFFTFVGDITQLYSKGGLRCTAIANATNWRLKPGGGGVNAAIFNAAGDALESATKEWAETLSPGSSISIPLPLTSPLYQREGVTHVIHVLGPNMNPTRPNYLNNDYVQGCKILSDAYSSLFESFASIMKKEKVKRTSDDDSEKTKKHKISDSDLGLNEECEKHSEGLKCDVKTEEMRSGVRTVRNWGSWALSLYEIAMNPDKHKDSVLEISNEFVVLNDLYPKAKKHVLVLSRFPGLDCLEDAKREHLPLLKTMHAAGVKLAKKFLTEDPSLSFRLGYHSIPSMRQLHLHVISQDFNSTCLKNKKHWNSFNTTFFRDSVYVIEEIDKLGSAKINGDDKLTAMELRCHRCRCAHPNIPRLKSHIANCKATFPSHLLQNGRLLSASSLTE